MLLTSSLVGQNPNMFDATILENIACRNLSVLKFDIYYAADVDKRYRTLAYCVRLTCPTPLARMARILILDKCLSALETVPKAKVGRTTPTTTHQLSVTQMCDLLALLDDSVVDK